MDEVLIEKINSTIVCTLNREKVLNALNLNMVRLIAENISNWENDENISGVLIKGAGEKSFCAGGDIVSVYHKKNDPESSLSYDFFKEEYLLNFEISKFNKPWISLLNGIAMGGGLGLSVHGSHRIVSEKTITAMPETAIGLFPDVGGGYFLSRMKGFLGTFLALTGNTLNGQDTIYSGIGTNFLEDKNISIFTNELLNLKKYNFDTLNNLLFKYDIKDKITSTLENYIELIDKNFSKSNIKEVFKSLSSQGSKWCDSQLGILTKKSPTSMGVALKQLRLSENLNLKDCLSMEFRICQSMMNKHDFYEGVRANLVDKDRNPQWKPRSVDELDNSFLDDHFKNLGDKELFL